MSLWSGISLASSVLSLLTGTVVYQKSPPSTLNRLFLALTICLAYTGFFEFGLRQASTAEAAMIWARLGAFWHLLLAFMLHFTLVFAGKWHSIKRAVRTPVVYGPAIVFSVLYLLPSAPLEMERFPWGWDYGAGVPTAAYVLDYVWATVMTFVFVAVLLRHYITSKSVRERRQALHIMLGFSAPALGAIIFYSMRDSLKSVPQIPDLTSFFTLIGLIVVGYGIWRKGLFALTPYGAAEIIASSMSNFLIIVDPSGTIQTVNPALLRMLSYDWSDLIGKDIGTILDEPSDLHRSLFASRPSVESLLKGKNGDMTPVLLSVSRITDKSSNVFGFVYVGIDLTEQKQTQKTLQAYRENLEELVRERTRELREEVRERRRTEKTAKASEERYRLLFDNAADAIFILRDGEVCFPNPMYERMTGYTSADMGDRCFSELIHPEDRERSQREQLLRPTNGHRLELSPFRIMAKGGDELWVQPTYVDIVWESQPATLCFLRDTTRQRNLEHQLFQSQKMEAIGNLAGGVAHDFNNLLQAIGGYTQMALMDAEEHSSISQNLTEVQRAIRRASDLTRHLLLFGRKADTKRSYVDLNRVVSNVTKLLSRTIPRMIDVETTLADELYLVHADRTQIEFALMNLGLNARDAMPHGGTLHFSTENIHIPHPDLSLDGELEAGDYVMVTVADTGHGMDEEILSHIYEPFFTTKERGKGTGLGLATVYGIFSEHAGYIACESRVGEGTAFRLFLPAQVEPIDGDGLNDGTTDVHGGDETVLFVDDERSLRDIAMASLHRFGYTVLSAADGESAIDIYGANHGRIALVIVDLIMPGMGGLKCLDELTKLDPTMKAIIASGSMEAKADIRTRAARAILAKPYSVNQLLRTVRDVLDE